MKQKSLHKYVFDDSERFLKNREFSVSRKNEVIRNLRFRFNIPSVSRKWMYCLRQCIHISIYLLLDIFLIWLVSASSKLDVVTLIVLIVIIIFFVFAMYIARNMWRTLTTPDDFFDELYINLIKDGTLVDGNIHIVTRRYKYRHIIYTLNNDDRTYEYTTLSEGLVQIGDNIGVLFVNEKVHIPL